MLVSDQLVGYVWFGLVWLELVLTEQRQTSRFFFTYALRHDLLMALSFWSLKGHPINARIKAKPQLNRFYGPPVGGVVTGVSIPGVVPAAAMGIVSPGAVPVPVILAAPAPGAPLPVAVPTPVLPAAAVAAASVVPGLPLSATTSTQSSAVVTPLKNGYTAGTTPPPVDGPLATSQQQHQQTHQAQVMPQQHHHQQQPRFLYATPPGAASYGGQPQLQLYAFHHPSSFYTPTVLQVMLTLVGCLN